MEYVIQVLKNRVTGIIPEELDDTIDLIKERFEEWERYTPPNYGKMAGKLDEHLRLMYPAGSQPHPDWEFKAWPGLTATT